MLFESREPVTGASLQMVQQQLETIWNEMLEAERRFFAGSCDVREERRASAANLVHYLALRQRDLRLLQTELASLGLSSLGRAESHVLGSVEAVLNLLRRPGCEGGVRTKSASPRNAADGRSRLDLQARALFGPAPAHRDVRIMVTVPSEAADDGRLVRDLLTSGMDCMRINAAHDGADLWARMLEHLKRASEQTGRSCRVLMDLAGPRLRTGLVQPGPPVVRWRPRRDACGRVEQPARIWLTARESPCRAPEAATTLPLAGAWLSELAIGDTIGLSDARDKKRELIVVAREAGGLWAESSQTAYILPGTRLRRKGHDGTSVTEVGELPPTPQAIVLKRGDFLLLVRDATAWRPAVTSVDGRVLEPAAIGVSLPAMFDDVRPGQAIWFDEGRVGGTIRSTEPDGIAVEISHAKPEGSKLAGEKGINLPDTDLRLPPLTDKDLDDLGFVAAHADLVGYSFVRTAADVETLQAEIRKLSTRELGLILKIETRRAFEQLPSLLLAAMRSPASGVMIARGDLAVECGFERLAEVQEEILWMAEASHTPVIWATQVLESLAKTGMPSRAEITDAAMGERAECVMLNKGPYVVEAVRALDDILTRMQDHQRKKSAMLRHLELADRFLLS
jgi:pyruvate kinase